MTASCSPLSQPARGHCRTKFVTAALRRRSLDDLIDEYLNVEAPFHEKERRFFGEPGLSFSEAVNRAALSVDRAGALHPHQYRLGYALCAAMADALVSLDGLARSGTDFEALLLAIESPLLAMPRVGELAAYDIASRIGHHLGVEPERVYLHCGTRAGARELGADWRQRSLPLAAFPAEFQRLTPAQAEDFLCIFKGKLAPAAAVSKQRQLAAARRRN